MKKIVLSVAMIAAVAAIAIGATTAYFSDTETSTGNTFTAGAIDLKVDSQCSYNGSSEACVGNWGQQLTNDGSKGIDITNEKFFNFGDLKPGDQGENTISLHVNNNPAKACVIFEKMQNNDNSQTEPEAAVDTNGLTTGELAQELNVFAWADDGDNIWESGETPLFSNISGPASDVLNGKSYNLGVLPGGSTNYIGLYWCYGAINVVDHTLSCSGSAVTNISQTDSLIGDIRFYVEQDRNNPNFVCPTPNSTKISANDLETGERATAKANGKWFFYNDTNDTIMPINQFSSLGGVNDIVTGPDAVGAAQMTLDTGTTPRYNIATYRYSDVKLSSISSLKYRIYDASASAETPYLNFNVDFDNSDTWQRRLVQVPSGVVVNTWTTVDALAGMWHLSGGNWPVGTTTLVPFAGSTDRTWAAIIADYPNAETRSTDSWLGVRVGHPGPAGETNYVDWIEFNGETSDFQN